MDKLFVAVVYQVVEDGYEFFAKRQLVTLFSAPNYCGEFDNAGAMMSVDETLMCSFQILKVLFCLLIGESVAGPFRFDLDPDPLREINKLSDSGSDLKCKIVQLFSLLFSIKNILLKL